MTPTPYINPYHLPGIEAKNGLQAPLLRKAQKELMAEFELNEAALIEIGDQSFGKSEVLAVFESLKGEDTRHYHDQLQQMPDLLAFLEGKNAAVFGEKAYQEMLDFLRENEAFQQFLAPYYAYRFNQHFLNLFKSKDEDAIRLLSSRPMWLPIHEQQSCYQDVQKHLQAELEGVKVLAKKLKHGNLAPGPEVQEAVDEEWIYLLNALPGSFDGILNAYAKALESLALALFNTYQRTKLAKYVLRQGLKLNINTETSGRLQYVLDQLLKISGDESFGLEDIQAVFENKKKGVKMWQLALGGLVMYLLFRLF